MGALAVTDVAGMIKRKGMKLSLQQYEKQFGEVKLTETDHQKFH